MRCDLPAVKDVGFGMDGVYSLKDIVELLEAERMDYAIKVPFWNWFGFNEKIAAQRRWRRVDNEAS